MPDGANQYQPHIFFKLNGSDAPADMQSSLLEMHIDSSLHLPDAATIVLTDNNTKWADHADVMPGKTLQIISRNGEVEDTIFDGEIVGLEPSFGAAEQKVTISAFDRLHRLSRGRSAKTFVQMTDSDIMKKIISDSGLDADVTSTSEVHDHVFQSNQTNLEFLQARAAALGYYLYAEGKKIHCGPPNRDAPALPMKLHTELSEFYPRLSTSGQVSKVQARGWDIRNKTVVLGEATKGEIAPKTGVAESGGGLAQSAHSTTANFLVNDPVVRTQAAAEKLAKAVANRLEGRFIEADGVAVGNPHLLAGTKIKIEGVGTRFSGEYFVTSSSHSFSAGGGYTTKFTVSGHDAQNLVSLLSPDREFRAPSTMAVAIVTDNNDPENMGRVKLKYPWLTEEQGSHWARAIGAGAGDKRGMLFVPEVGDEVLVGFEHGDIDFPCVLGGLWNGKDAPPLPSGESVKNGKTDQRVIRSRTGHVIILNDSDDKPSITIRDKTEKNLINIDSSSNAMKIQIEGDIDISAKGNIKIDSQKAIEITASSDIKINGSTGVKVDGGPTVDVKATSIAVKADASLDLKANGTANLEASGMTNIKGGLVKIN